nr:unnamed protein product [Spirometra erinaceieuropaei]
MLSILASRLRSGQKIFAMVSPASPLRRTAIFAGKPLPIPSYLLDRTVPSSSILKNLQPEDQKRLEFIKTEHSAFVADGKQAPLHLSDDDLLELLCCTSVSARRKYYAFRFKVSMKREAKAAKQLQRVKESKSEVEYIQKNQILHVVRETPIRAHLDDWLAAELRNPDSSQMLLFDCSHEEEMRVADQKNLAKQMALVLSHNRQMRPIPFHLVLTSLIQGTNQYQFFANEFNARNDPSGPQCLENCLWTIRPEHYLELSSFLGGRRIVYLSPNAPRAFEPGEWDNNAAYVVGGIVDKAIRRPVTHARARRSGVECVRLPIERYLHWRAGSKTLTLVAIHGILATAKATNGDWKTALEKNVPIRFLREHDPVQREIDRMLRQV